MVQLMKKIIQFMKNDTMIKGFSLLLSGSAIAQIFAFIVSPILTRLYTPAEYGINSVFMAILTINSVFATLRIQVPLSITNKDREKSILTNVGFYLTILFSILVLILTSSLGEEISILFDIKDEQWLKWLPLSTLGIGLYEVFYHNLLGNQRYKEMTYISIMKVVLQEAFQIGLSFFNIGFQGLIIGNLISYVVINIFMIYTISPQLLKFKKEEYLSTIKDNLDYPKFAFPAELLGMSSRQFVPLILTFLFLPEVSGFYALANRLIGVPINLIANSLRQVYIKEASVEFAETKSIKNNFIKTSKILFVISIPICIGIYIIGPYFFGIVFGDEWVESGYYLRALIPFFISRFTIVPLMSSMYIIKKTKFEILSNSILVLALLTLTIVFKVFNLNNQYLFLWSYSLIYALIYVFIYFLMYFLIKKVKN